MAKKEQEYIPIMSKEDEAYMVFTGLIKWTRGVIEQGKKLQNLDKQVLEYMKTMKRVDEAFLEIRDVQSCEQHYFMISANKLIEYREWIKDFGLFNSVDFSEIDSFSKRDIKDLRNMNEHVKDYFSGFGDVRKRWVFETSEYQADASSRIDNKLGGRLDYVIFCEAAKQLLPQLLKEPIPYPQEK